MQAGVPCGGERLLLMFDRWRKLLKAFHNEKKKQYDISKIPDIYDSAKYDAIHNSHLPLDLQPVYKVRRRREELYMLQPANNSDGMCHSVAINV